MTGFKRTEKLAGDTNVPNSLELSRRKERQRNTNRAAGLHCLVTRADAPTLTQHDDFEFRTVLSVRTARVSMQKG